MAAICKDITWAVEGRGNYWSDYAGYDANGDGVGDVPYRTQKLFDSLMDEEPSLRLFLFSPASMAIDFAGRAVPPSGPKPSSRTRHPLMRPGPSPLLPDATTAGKADAGPVAGAGRHRCSPCRHVVVRHGAGRDRGHEHLKGEARRGMTWNADDRRVRRGSRVRKLTKRYGSGGA